MGREQRTCARCLSPADILDEFREVDGAAALALHEKRFEATINSVAEAGAVLFGVVKGGKGP